MSIKDVEKPEEKEELEKVKRMRTEVRSYKGIEYAIILCGVEKYGLVEADASEKEDEQWWCVEYTDKSKKLALRSFRGCLYYDSRFMTGYRLMDKYHHCELQAMGMISYLQDKYLWKRFQELFRENRYYFYSFRKLIFKTIWYKIKSRLGIVNDVQEINK